jgi:hypothetical protein
VFLDHRRLAAGGLAGCHALAMSGGDTFGVAAALGAAGAAALEEFIARGGLYLGTCAGAYLPLNSSKSPLDLFNWVPARITNLSRHLPVAIDLPEKAATPYGCAYVFHPVREEVRLATCGRQPWAGQPPFVAPLYGGPAMVEAAPGQVLARYLEFTPRTRFLVDPGLAAETLVGRAAALRVEKGQGVLYLLGPHFEHPRYPEANRLLAQALCWDLAPAAPLAAVGHGADQTLTGRAARAWLTDLKREVSNVRIVGLGLESHPARWRLGHKVYEPAKLRVYAEAAWRRLRRLERAPELVLPPAGEELTAAWRGVREQARSLQRGLAAGRDTQATAQELFPALGRATAALMETYFRNLLARPGLGRRRRAA